MNSWASNDGALVGVSVRIVEHHDAASQTNLSAIIRQPFDGVGGSGGTIRPGRGQHDQSIHTRNTSCDRRPWRKPQSITEIAKWVIQILRGAAVDGRIEQRRLDAGWPARRTVRGNFAQARGDTGEDRRFVSGGQLPERNWLLEDRFGWACRRRPASILTMVLLAQFGKDDPTHAANGRDVFPLPLAHATLWLPCSDGVRTLFRISLLAPP